MKEMPQSLRELSSVWLTRVRAPKRRAIAFASVLLVFVALLIARVGTTRARGLAALLVMALASGAFVWRKQESKIQNDPRRTLSRIGRAVPEIAERAARAISLLEAPSTGTSEELAELHVSRTIAALPRDRVEHGASRLAFFYGIAAFAFAAVAFASCASNPWGLVEGADVLLAREGKAPMPLIWLVDLDVVARPPDYLHQEERRVSSGETELPNGALLTVHGVPVHSGRRLFLTDGKSEVPLVGDGTERVVARWPLSGDSSLRVIAKFGDVVIEEPRALDIRAIMDEKPAVHLESAPRTLQLAAPNAADIDIRYEARDDHALREVHLVLRSGSREERRVLAKLDGETKNDRGGHVLRLSDPFLKKSHAPIEVTVEAKDNDPITGPKWGASEAITVIPPDVGEPEAQRLDGLRELRNVLVDSLASRLAPELPADHAAFLAEEEKRSAEAISLVDQVANANYSGARLPGRLRAILRGQERKMADALARQKASLNAQTRAAVVHANERFALVVDAMIAGQGQRDSREASEKLADVADELSAELGLLGRDASQEVRENGGRRIESFEHVLKGGEKSLFRLGALGKELGEITNAYLLRIERARGANDFAHAELAAQDLSTRLHTPDPSFGAKGKGRGGAGESGGGEGMPSEADSEGSDVEQAFNEAAQDLERLSEDHAGNIGKVEQALSGAESEEDKSALKEEGKKHAEAVRQATKNLPTVGGGSDTWTGKAALAREHAEQTARSMEQGNPADAVVAGQNALQALEEAKRLASRERWGSKTQGEEQLDEARRKLEPEVRWAEKQLQEMKKKASDRARGELQKRGEEEGQLADRVRALGKKGREGESMPESALDALESAERLARNASESLKQGDSERALDQQRQSQQKLSAAKHAMEDGEDDGRGPNESRSSRSAGEAGIPKADAHKGPEEFRRRVMKGLGQATGSKERDAVKRYAEGLLK